MNWTEVTTDFSKLLFVDYAVQLDLKATALDVLQGHISRFLATNHSNVELLVVTIVKEGTDRGTTTWLLTVFENSYLLKSLWM